MIKYDLWILDDRQLRKKRMIILKSITI